MGGAGGMGQKVRMRTLAWPPIAALLLTSLATDAIAAEDGTALGLFIGFFVIAALLGFYFLPAIIAASRDHNQQGPIFIICLLTGWTGIGWVIALAWSVSGQPKPSTPVRDGDQTF